MTRSLLTQSELVAGRQDRQIVVRLPSALLAAVEEHRRRLQEARPFERVTLAVAVRDLLAVAVTKGLPRKRS